MNIPLCPGRVALTTKLCPASSRSKNNIAVDMNKNIKAVFTLLKQPVSERKPAPTQMRSSACFGSSTTRRAARPPCSSSTSPP